MTNSRLINIYVDPEDGLYVIVYDNGETFKVTGSVETEGEFMLNQFVVDVSNYIKDMEFQKSIIIQKYKSEVKRLEEINHKMYIELERLQRLEDELKSQKQGE